MKPIWWRFTKRLTRAQVKRLYMPLIPTIRRVARSCGYAIGIHGSLSRDLDVMAMPWTRRAVLPVTLAARIHKAVSKYAYSAAQIRKQGTGGKPHRREAYALILGTHASGTRHSAALYIDLSAVPPERKGLTCHARRE